MNSAATSPVLEVGRPARARSAGWSRSTTSALRSSSGEIIGLLGPNGSGKTTALNLMSGVLRPDAGTIRLMGRDITGLPPTGSRGSASRAPSSSSACSTAWIAARTSWPGWRFRSRICTAAEAEARIDTLLDRVGLAGHAHGGRRPTSPISTASGWSLRARWPPRPRLLLLDEWLAGLNPSELDDRHRPDPLAEGRRHHHRAGRACDERGARAVRPLRRDEQRPQDRRRRDRRRAGRRGT